MKMPNPIAIRFAKLIFSILSITVLGVIFAMISHDHTGSKPKGDEADSSQGTTKTAQKSTGKVRPEQTIPSGDDDDDLPL